MLRIFAAVIVIISVSASSDFCEEPIHEVCPRDRLPNQNIETREDLLNFCGPAIYLMKCGIKYEDKCNQNPEIKVEGIAILKVLEEVCDPDTLLHSAVVANLKCFSEFEIEKSGNECYEEKVVSIETIYEIADALLEEGLLVLDDDDEHAINHTYACLYSFQELPCIGLEMEKKCGTLAMETFVEIVVKASPAVNIPCKDTIELLPAFIRLYKLKRPEEKRNIISEIFRKRK